MAEPRLHGGPDAFGAPRYDFSTNSNACGPCPSALVAVRSADPTRYPDPNYQALRAALAGRHGVDPERVLLAASASEFIFRISALAAQTGWQSLRQYVTYAVPGHAYGDYSQAAHIWNLQPTFNASDADLTWACDPSSPMGQPYPGLARQAGDLRSGQILVLDCAYRPLRLEGNAEFNGPGLDRVWQLWTPNKALGLTGVRAAYVIAPLGAQAQTERLQALAPSWPVGAHGVAMLQAWCEVEARNWLSASLATLSAWKQRQLELCEELGWHTWPSVTNFFVARPNSVHLTHDLRLLRAQGIKLRDAASFGLPGCVRLGVLAPEAQGALWQAWTSIRSKT